MEDDEDLYAVLTSPASYEPGGTAIISSGHGKGRGVIIDDDSEDPIDSTSDPQKCFCPCACSSGDAAASIDKATGAVQVMASMSNGFPKTVQQWWAAHRVLKVGCSLASAVLRVTTSFAINTCTTSPR